MKTATSYNRARFSYYKYTSFICHFVPLSGRLFFWGGEISKSVIFKNRFSLLTSDC